MAISTKKVVWEDFRIKNLGDYDDPCMQSNTLLLVEVFENLSNKCREILT